MAAAIPAAIMGVASIGGALISSGAQSSAANTVAQTQAQSSAQQIALLQSMYNTNTANAVPYMNAGYGALAAKEQLLGLKPLTAAQFNSGQWFVPGSVNYSAGGTGTTTPTTGTTPSTSAQGNTPSSIGTYTLPPALAGQGGGTAMDN